MTQEEKKDKLQRVGIYQDSLSMENSLLQGYRALFLTFEVILLTLGVGLLALEKEEYILIPIIIGIVFCLASTPIFSWGRRRVDYWRDKIFEEVKGTDIETIFEIYRPVYLWIIPSPTSPRFWFDLISPLIMGLVWILVLFISHS